MTIFLDIFNENLSIEENINIFDMFNYTCTDIEN